jgi:nitroreductase
MIQPFYEGKDTLIRDEAMRSSALAGMTLMLAAKDMGYDSCPMIGFDGEKVAELINLPQHYALSFMIPVGKQAQLGWERGDRLADERVVAYDKFA